MSPERIARRGALRGWVPVVAWLALIVLLSSELFTPIRTGAIADPILRGVIPDLSGVALDMAHGLARKLAHFTVYAVLFLLLVRGPLAGRDLIALAVCIAVAFLDEAHQMVAPGRGASLYDVALNSSGALFARFLYVAANEVRSDRDARANAAASPR